MKLRERTSRQPLPLDVRDELHVLFPAYRVAFATLAEEEIGQRR